jgi:mannosidase alpha-like ER degradation enhancer 1
MKFAFPHDELQPLSLGWADSLEELGDATRDPSSSYSGVALTLIDALDTLGVMGNATEFTRGVSFICQNVSFDKDVRVNVFELNIRVLGGLLSAHYLAGDQSLGLMLGRKYDGCLLDAALDVGNRMVPAFRTSTKIPQPWINLAKGPIRGDSRTQCTAGCGTLLLEFGLLSRLTGNSTFHTLALEALQALWSRRSSIGLLGNTLDYGTGRWQNENAGVGAGVDSFYECEHSTHPRNFLIAHRCCPRPSKTCGLTCLFLGASCSQIRAEELLSLRFARPLGDVGRSVWRSAQVFETRAVVRSKSYADRANGP